MARTWYSKESGTKNWHKYNRDRVSINGVPELGFDTKARSSRAELFLRLYFVGEVQVNYELWGAENIEGLFRNTSSVALEDLVGKKVYVHVRGGMGRAAGLSIDDELRAENQPEDRKLSAYV